jgi:hypothetical protein
VKAFFINLMSLNFYTPMSYKDAMKSKAMAEWRKATNNKILSSKTRPGTSALNQSELTSS